MVTVQIAVMSPAEGGRLRVMMWPRTVTDMVPESMTSKDSGLATSDCSRQQYSDYSATVRYIALGDE